jgi:hypothetical protein
MVKKPDTTFEVGDRVKFVLRSGEVADGMVRAVTQTTHGAMLNISFGRKGDLAASVNARQVVEILG